MKDSVIKSINISFLIAKLVIPFTILSEILQYLGYIDHIAFIFEPITNILSLPAEVAVAFAAAFFLNIYAGIAVAAGLGLNAYEWTIVGTFIAICHSIPLEATVMKKLGFSIHIHWITRLFAGLLGAWIASLFIPLSITSQIVTADVAIKAATFTDMLIEAILASIILTIKIVCLVSSLVVGFDLIKKIPAVDKLMNRHTYISSLTVGSLLGITYGAGILLKEIHSVSHKAKRNLLVFLMLAHGLIEETLIFAIFGADIAIIFAVRTAIAIVAVIFVNASQNSFPNNKVITPSQQN